MAFIMSQAILCYDDEALPGAEAALAADIDDSDVEPALLQSLASDVDQNSMLLRISLNQSKSSKLLYHCSKQSSIKRAMDLQVSLK